jgi:histidinol phosphatase-like enzyme (inositol monophosphatase family)
VQFEKELHLLRSMAMHAGELALGYQQQELVAEEKPDLSPVTIADRECERLIASRIGEAFPDDGVLGEEGASRPSKNGRLWIIDPIDGTRDFVRGLPLWSTLIGLEVDGEVVAGVCHVAARGEMYSAVRGVGAWLNEEPISISKVTEPQFAVACVTALNSCQALPFGSRLLEWMQQFWAVRSLGGCVDAMMVASGRAEIWIEPSAKAWDLAPLKVILEAAGAKFLNFDGGSSIRGGNCIACVPALQPVVQDLI